MVISRDQQISNGKITRLLSWPTRLAQLFVRSNKRIPTGFRVVPETETPFFVKGATNMSFKIVILSNEMQTSSHRIIFPVSMKKIANMFC